MAAMLLWPARSTQDSATSFQLFYFVNIVTLVQSSFDAVAMVKSCATSVLIKLVILYETHLVVSNNGDIACSMRTCTPPTTVFIGSVIKFECRRLMGFSRLVQRFIGFSQRLTTVTFSKQSL